MRPTRLLIGVAIAGGVTALLPIMLHPRLWTFWPLFWGALLLIAAVDALLIARPKTLQCALELPATLYIGESDPATLTVTLPRRRALRVTAVLDTTDHLRPLEALSGTTDESGAAQIAIELTPLRRGTAVIERVWVRFSGPLGLVGATVVREQGLPLPVVPNIRPVQRTAMRFFTEREFREGFKVERFRGQGTEFDSLKEYVQGDDHRQIDWKSSGRHMKLMCRQHRAERNHQVVLAIDTGHLMIEPLEGIPRLDHAINVALLLAYVCLATGDRVGLFSFDAGVGLSYPPQGGLNTHRLLTQLTSRIEYSEAETNFTLGLTSLAQSLRRRSLVIVLTEFVDTVTAELMMENLGRLARRHLTVFVALQDPGLATTSRSRPTSLSAINRSVVADSFLHDRQVVLQRLRRQGVMCIDSVPSRIGTEVVSQYLTIKRRELI